MHVIHMQGEVIIQVTCLMHCLLRQPLILHHWKAAAILLTETSPVQRVAHLCEYMLLVDKVKEPRDLFELWNRLTASHYHDFSAVFRYNDETGWQQAMTLLMREEEECERSAKERMDNSSMLNVSSACIFDSSDAGERRLRGTVRRRRRSTDYFADIYFDGLLARLSKSLKNPT